MGLVRDVMNLRPEASFKEERDRTESGEDI